jgi:predicted DNA-binding transcriptional regulator YafY
MAKRLAFERYLWFHARLKQRRFPKLRDLMEKFEISSRQAAREIEFMRDFFNAPIEYSAEESGYYYADDSFDLPGIWTSEEEIVALIIAKRLSGSIPDKKIKKKIDVFFKKIYAHIDLDLTGLEEKISLKNIRYYAVEPSIFNSTVLGLSKGRRLQIVYCSAYTRRETSRVVNPLHLLLYMGNWHLIAYCESKKGIRDFVLSRIRSAEILDEAVAPRLTDEVKSVAGLIENNYGIFFEGEPREVVIRFDLAAATLVRDQIWFPGQKVVDRADGSIDLSFPVSDFREVMGDILRFGPDAEVLAPPELRTKIKQTIARMNSIYRK